MCAEGWFSRRWWAVALTLVLLVLPGRLARSAEMPWPVQRAEDATRSGTVLLVEDHREPIVWMHFAWPVGDGSTGGRPGNWT